MVPAVTLSVWSTVSLLRLEIKNELRLSPQNEGALERNGCLTANGLLTRFLWTTLSVGALWTAQCALTINGRLWNDAVIEVDDAENGQNDHDVSRIVVFFGLDLLSMILLLILYYGLLAEMDTLKHIEVKHGDDGLGHKEHRDFSVDSVTAKRGNDDDDDGDRESIPC